MNQTPDASIQNPPAPPTIAGTSSVLTASNQNASSQSSGDEASNQANATSGTGSGDQSSRQSNLQRIQLRKQQVYNWTHNKKLLKLAIYSACQVSHQQ